MQFAYLGSGSKGNAALIEAEQTCLMLDCGFSVRETLSRLSRLGRSGEDLEGILVTHEHSDHISGVGVLARKLNIPVWATAGTWRLAMYRSEISLIISTAPSPSATLKSILFRYHTMQKNRCNMYFMTAMCVLGY